MEAKNLLQELRSKISTDSEITENEAVVSSISGTDKEASVTVFWPVEGVIRVFEVRAKEMKPYLGLEL